MTVNLSEQVLPSPGHGRRMLGRKAAPLPPLIVCLAFCAASCASPPPDFDEAQWYEKVKAEKIEDLYGPHEKEDGTFFNPWLSRPERPSGSWRSRKKTAFPPFPEEDYAWQKNDYVYLKDKNFDSISFAGHASMIIKMNGETVFADPFFSNYALIIGKKVKIKFDFSQVPERPVMILSHNHYDHLDKKTVRELIKKKAVFLVPLRMKEFFTSLGAEEVYELDWWQSLRIGPLNYTFLPVQHWSRRIGQKSGSTLWGSWLIEGSKTVYFSGDTGYFRGFEEYGRRYKIDYALLGAGAYEPRWFMHYSHMNIAEFFMAADDLKARLSIPMHFGVISLSDEPLVYPLYEAEEHIKKNPRYGEKIRLLRVGEYIPIE